jgi:hypothetical protein
MENVNPEQFRRMYQNMLDGISGVRGRFVVKTDSKDDWIIITHRAVTGVYIWHQFKHDTLELAFDGERANIVNGLVPAGAEDRSAGNKSFRQYRWPVKAIDVTKPPYEQDGVTEAIDRTIWAFEWVAQNKRN